MLQEQTQTLCAHCGDPCNDGDVALRDLHFCCAGCKSVYEILSSKDLCDYYNISERAGSSMRNAHVESSEFDVLDNDTASRPFIVWSNNNSIRLRFEIPSMHCASCVWLLDQLQTFDDGIVSSEVDVTRKSVSITLDRSITSVASVARLLASIGYRPLLATEHSKTSAEYERRDLIRKAYSRIGVAGFVTGNVMMMSIARYLAGEGGLAPQLDSVFNVLSMLLSIPVLLYCAQPWFASAFGALKHRKINLDVPVAIGITAVFVRSVADVVLQQGEGFLDSFAGLVLFLLIGRLFQQKAFDAVSFDRTFRSFFPLSVRTTRKGETHMVPIGEVQVGDAIVVRNNEIIPCDAVLISPVAYVDYSFVTGESAPVECVSGSMVHAGGKVIGQAVSLTATREVSHSHLASLWERSGKQRQRRAYLDLSDRFGARFTMVMLAIAAIGFVAWLPDVHQAINVATAVLIIACPCALTIAAPVTLGTAMGVLGKMKVYIKNVGTLLELADVQAVVFDKTGTLTEPGTELTFEGRVLSSDEQRWITSVASNSIHPRSRGIAQQAYADDVDDVREVIGEGIQGSVDGHTIRIGTPAFADAPNTMQRVTSVSIDGEYAGSYVVNSRLHPDVAEMLTEISVDKEVWLASGDNNDERELFSASIDDRRMFYEQTPQQKVDLLNEIRSNGKRVMMVGDGLNDASAMENADVAVAVSSGTSTIVPACDAIIPDTMVRRLPQLMSFARSMTRVIKVNLIFTVFYNALGLGLALAGLLQPMITAIMMPVSSLIVVGLSVGGARYFARRIV